MSKLFFKNALLPDGWAENVTVEIGADGRIVSATANTPPQGASFDGAVAVPGIGNLHSHAFQRAFAGLGEWRGKDDDDFWSWREVMYRFVERLTPDDLNAIATMAYIEMLEAGYTSVGEFHYVHHRPDGRAYDDVGEMTVQVIEAARVSGIGLTLLPVLYAYGDFGAKLLVGAQLRFRHDADSFLKLVVRCRELAADSSEMNVGIAPHSLRAVSPEMLSAVLAATTDGPVHIHIAEQEKEVDACVAWSGARPVEWLLDQLQVDTRWCLVHATHMTDAETQNLAASGAVAGLCPTTEANLGDGIFNGVEYHAAGGRWGVGSDSHIRIDAAEELRLLEVSQRLRDHSRLKLAGAGRANGRTLFDSAVAGGAQALGHGSSGMTPGARADIISLDPDHPSLIGRAGDDWLNGWILGGDRTCVADVWSAGRHVVKNRVHKHRQAAIGPYRLALARLTA